MSNRRRSSRSPRSYTARLQRGSLPRARLRRPGAPRRWRSTPWLAAPLALVGEAGHLAAAFLEWPESAARGAYQVVAGALLGLVAAVVLFAASRVRLGAATAAAAAGPALWLGGALLGASPYGELPVPAAAGIAVCEVALAALLLVAWQAAEPPPPERAAAPQTARTKSPQRHPA
jgi:hypothetical protein